MLRANDCILLIIDIQEKLVKACKDSDTITHKSEILANAAGILEFPVIITEQYPKGLGATIEGIKQACASANYQEKTYFSALKENGFKDQIANLSKNQIILCGIETHICVYQTCLDLLSEGYEVFVVKDCCSSRNEFEYITGLDLMKDAGAKISCLEVVLFELLQGAKHPHFKEVQALIK